MKTKYVIIVKLITFGAWIQMFPVKKMILLDKNESTDK